MKTRDKFTALVLTALLLVPLLAYSVQGANVIQDLFESLFGKGADILDIAQLYDKYFQVIDFIVLLFLFIPACQATIGNRFKDAGNSGKFLPVIIGVMLAIGSEWWMATNKMKLGDFSKIGIFILLALIAVFLYNLAKGFAGNKWNGSWAAATYLLAYFMFQAVAPAYLEDIQKNVPIVSSIITLLFLIALFYTGVSILNLVKSVGGGGTGGGRGFLGGLAGLVGGDSIFGGGGGGGGGLRGGPGGGPSGPDIGSMAKAAKAEKEESLEELRLERNITKVTIKDKKDAEDMVKVLSKVIKELDEKGFISAKTAKEFNAKVATDGAHMELALATLQQYINELKHIEDSELKIAGDTKEKLIKALLPEMNQERRNELSKLEKDLKDHMSAIQSEYMLTRHSMEMRLARIREDTNTYAMHIRTGIDAYKQYGNTRAPGDKQNVITQFNGAKKVLSELMQQLNSMRQESKMKKLLDRRKIQEINRATIKEKKEAKVRATRSMPPD